MAGHCTHCGGSGFRRPSQEKARDEVLERVRRIETRVTQTMVAIGVPTSAQKPKFNARESSILLPSPHTSTKEMLEHIPETWNAPVKVFVGDEQIATITPERAEKRAL